LIDLIKKKKKTVAVVIVAAILGVMASTGVITVEQAQSFFAMLFGAV
jgi:hypothetical protein